MKQKIVYIALIVRDYEEAIQFYTEKLNFRLMEDSKQSETKRWVQIAPPGFDGCSLVLAKATNDIQRSLIGNQTGGRVFLFLSTDDIQRDYQMMLKNGINFTRHPKVDEYGIVAVFEDLYGNLWDLIEFSERS